MAFVRVTRQDKTYRSNSKFEDPQKLLEWAREQGITTEPLDIVSLANKLNILVRYEILDDQISGKLSLEGRDWIITVNSLHHPNRQRFTIAHEIAHLMLHTRNQSEFEDTAFFRGNGYSTLESQANDYAGSILMPEKKFDAFVQKVSNNVGEIAKHFGVSSLAVRYRAKKLGYTGHNL